MLDNEMLLPAANQLNVPPMLAFTFNVALLEVLPLNVAVMIEEFTLRPVAMPLALTLATDVLEEFQVTDPEIFPVLLSEYVPVAM